jgi:hypothetical protein
LPCVPRSALSARGSLLVARTVAAVVPVAVVPVAVVPVAVVMPAPVIDAALS